MRRMELSLNLFRKEFYDIKFIYNMITSSREANRAFLAKKQLKKTRQITYSDSHDHVYTFDRQSAIPHLFRRTGLSAPNTA
jgi:hypothetical protein